MQNQFRTVLNMPSVITNIGFVFPQDLKISDPCNLSLVVLSLGCRSNPSIILQKNSNLFVQSISFDRYLNLSILCIVISSHQAGRQVCLLKGKRSPSAGLVFFIKLVRCSPFHRHQFKSFQSLLIEFHSKKLITSYI